MATANAAVEAVKSRLKKTRASSDVFHSLWYTGAKELAHIMEVPETKPRTGSIMAHRSNPDTANPEGYYRAVVTVPMLGTLFILKL